MKLLKGRDGLVRTALVGLRNLRKGSREALQENKAGLSQVELPVQRLVLLLPGKDQPQAILAKLKDQPEALRVPVVPQPTVTRGVSWQDQGVEEMIDL